MLVGSHQRTKGLNLTLALDGILYVLKQVCSTKNLGAYLDQHLTWQSHVDYVLGKVRGKFSAIKLVYLGVLRLL